MRLALALSLKENKPASRWKKKSERQKLEAAKIKKKQHEDIARLDGRGRRRRRLFELGVELAMLLL